MSLVVIERKHSVPRTLEGKMENGIRRVGTINVKALTASFFYGGHNLDVFLVAKQPVLAAVGVQPGHDHGGSGM